MSEEFDPYYEWLGIPPKDQPPHHYRLLGIELFEQNLNVIERAADRQMGHVRSYQTGRHSRESQRLLNELSAAKVCLLNAQRKTDYDEQLRQKVSTSLPDFGVFGDGQFGESQVPGFPPPLPDSLPDPFAGTLPPGVVPPGVVPSGTVPPGANSIPAAAVPAVPVISTTPAAAVVVAAANHNKKPKAIWYAGAAVSEEAGPRPRAAWQQLTIGFLIGLALLGVGGVAWWWSSRPPSELIADPGVPPQEPGGGSSPVGEPVPAPVAPSPPATPAQPLPERIPSWLKIVEGVENIADPAVMNPLPVASEGLRSQIQGAGGFVEERFAFCQTLLGNLFPDVNNELRALGYRLGRCRPYFGLGDCRVAAIWYRDFLPTRCVALTDAATLQSTDAQLQSAGFIPVDVTGLAVEGMEYFGAVWVKPTGDVRSTRLTLALSQQDYEAAARQQRQQGYRPAIYGGYFLGAEPKHYELWVPTEDSRPAMLWEGNQEKATKQLARPQLTVDASILLSPTDNSLVFRGVKWPIAAEAGGTLIGIPPEAMQSAARELILGGQVPVSWSVVSLPHGELQAISVWRPAAKLTTALELAHSTSGTVPASPEPTTTSPPTSPPPTTESMPTESTAPTRALQFTAASHLELQDSLGLARISTDFTVEAWIQFSPAAQGTANLLFGTGAYKNLHPEVTDVAMKGWLMGVKPATVASGGKSQFILQWAEASGETLTHTGEIPAWTDGWHHLAICNQGAGKQGAAGAWHMQCYLDGALVLEATHDSSADLPGPVPFYLGRPRWVAAGRRALQGSLRGFRLSEGIRYTERFEPAAKWSVDDRALVLLDFANVRPRQVLDLTERHRNGQFTDIVWIDEAGAPIATAPLATDMPAPAAPPPGKHAIPADIEQGVAKIRAVFQSEIAAAKEPAQLLTLAEKLLSQAESEADPPLQYALLEESRRLAIEAGDWPATARAIEVLAGHFEVNPWQLRGESFSGLNKKVKVAADRKVLADAALGQAEAALADAGRVEGVLEGVETLLASASNLAPRGEKEIVKQVADLRRRLGEEKKSQQSVRDARDKLASNPNDPAANDVLGRYLCFLRDDWETGLSHLAQGATVKLANLAKQESTPPANADERQLLADGWAEYAKSAAESNAKSGAAARALFWYRLALADTSGVKKLQIEKHIEDLEKIALPSRSGKSRATWLEGQPGLAWELQGHTSRVTCMAIARSGRFLVSGSQDGTIRLWDLTTGKQSGQVTTSSQNIQNLLLSSDDRVIAVPFQARQEFHLGLWNLQSGQMVGSVTTAWQGTLLAGATDWKRVVYGSQQPGPANLLVYDLTTLKPVAPVNCPGPPLALAVSRSGRYLAAADGSNAIYLWDLQTGKPATPLSGHAEPVMSLVFSPNERQLLSCSYRSLIAWDVTSGAEDRRIATQETATAATYSPDGSRLLVSGNSMNLQVLAAKDGTRLANLSTGSSEGSSSMRTILCFPDGRGAATVGDDVVIRIWRLPP